MLFQYHALILPYLEAPIHPPMNIIAICVEPNILTIYHKCPYGGNNPNLTLLLFGIPCLLIVVVFLQILPDIYMNLSHVS